MDRNRSNTLVTPAAALAGGLSGAALSSQPALPRDATLQPTAADAVQTPLVNAKSVLLAALAPGYAGIRIARPVHGPAERRRDRN